MSYLEDYNSFYRVDGGRRMDIRRGSAVYSDLRTDGAPGSYIRRDYHNYTFGDFTHQLKVIFNSVNTVANVIGGVWAVSNTTVGTHNSFDTANDGIGIYFKLTGADYDMFLRDYVTDNEDTVTLAQNTNYWLTVTRNGTSVSCEIYSDSGRTSLVDTLNVTSAATEYTWLYAVYSDGRGLGNGVSAGQYDLYLGEVMEQYYDFEGPAWTLSAPTADIVLDTRDVDAGNQGYYLTRQRRDSVSYLRRDKGAGDIDDFEYEFIYQCTIDDTAASNVIFGCTNSNFNLQDMLDNNDGLVLSYYDAGAGDFRFTLYDRDGSTSDTYEASADMEFYGEAFETDRWFITFTRSGSTVTVKFYDDPKKEAANLKDTLTVTSSTTYRYEVCMCGRAGTTLVARSHGHVLQDLYNPNEQVVAPSILGGYIFAYNRNNSMLYTPVGTSYRQLQTSNGSTVATTQSVGVTTESCAMVDNNTLLCGCEESSGTHGLRKYAIDDNWVDTTEEEIDINTANDGKKHTFSGDPTGYLNEQM